MKSKTITQEHVFDRKQQADEEEEKEKKKIAEVKEKKKYVSSIFITILNTHSIFLLFLFKRKMNQRKTNSCNIHLHHIYNHPGSHCSQYHQIKPKYDNSQKLIQ